MKAKRVFLLVMDSFGIGELPDAANFGDHDCNTLRSVVSSKKFIAPNLKKLGLFNITGVDCGEKAGSPVGAFGKMTERSLGKDTTTGHWEIAGLTSYQAMPTFPDGFPDDLIATMEKAFGRKTLCNKPYSGTQVIHDYGEEQLKTGALITYTSADSVYQIAAHEKIIPVEKLYEYCRQARKLLVGKWGVGRVIARPYIGDYPNFERTPRRHDFSLLPPKSTLLDILSQAGLDVLGVGKISDIFAARGITRSVTIEDNTDGMNKTMAFQKEDFTGLCFVNLVDFDMQYGHRRDVDGYAEAVSTFDDQLTEFMANMRPDDVLMITADHGCDPEAPGTDHTREYTPLLIYGQPIKAGIDLGIRDSFADIAATIAENFEVEGAIDGKSFWADIFK